MPSPRSFNEGMGSLYTYTTHLPISVLVGKVFLCVGAGDGRVIFALLFSVLVTLNCLTF